MSVSLSILAGAGWQFFNDAGDPLSGGRIYTYTAGTTTPQATYTEKTGTIANSNPILLDAAGRTPQEVWLTNGIEYKFVLEDSAANLIGTYDNLRGIDDLWALTNSSNVNLGDALVAFKQSNPSGVFPGAVASTIHNKTQEYISVRDFGAVGDGLANDTDALQAALDAVFANNGGTLHIPHGNYRITANLQPQISASPLNRNFRIIGDGMESTNILGGSAGFGFKIYGDTPPSRNNAFTSLVLQNFSMVGSATAGIGIDIYSMQRSVISGVSCRGFNYGVRIRSSWNNSINNRCQFSDNNVGIKVPGAGAGSTLNEGFNITDISGISCGNNIKAGISIGFCNVVSIRDVLLESNPIGIYILQSAQWVYINNLYYEKGNITLTRLSRSGVLTPYLIYTGSDEDFAVGDTNFPIKNVVINNAMEYFGEGKIWLDNVVNVSIPNGAVSESTLYNITDNAKFVRAHGVQGDNRFSTILQDGKTASTANGAFKTYPYNLINNGNMAYPILPPIRNATGTATATRTTQSVNGTNSSVMAVNLPIGETTNRFFFIAWLGNEFGTNGAELTASIRCKASSADIATVALDMRNNGGTVLSGYPANKSSGLTNWFALSFGANPTEYGATPACLVSVTVTRTTAAAADTLYIDEVILTPREAAGLTTMGPQDLDCGLTGSVVPTNPGGGSPNPWYYETVTLGLQSGTESYRVVATPRFDSAYTAANVQIAYLSGADEGKFNVWCDRSGVTIDYHVFRIQHRAP